MEQMWHVRELCAPALNAAFSRSWKYDLSVSLRDWQKVIDYVREKVGDRGEVLVWGHLGDNNIHLNVVSKNPSVDLRDVIEPGLFDVTMELGGSISAEHGIGKAKNEYLERALGREVVEKMKEVKHLFDPNGILGSGKLLK